MHIRELIVAVVSLIALHSAGQFVPAAARYDGLISETVFIYDDNGNMTSDGRKGLEMSWNLLNLADSVAMHGSSLTYAYLPFGTKIRNSGQASFAANRWRYAGKEEQRFSWTSASQTTTLDLSLLDFGARMYDSFTARWTSVDPMAGKQLAESSMCFCSNDPVFFFDPDGRKIQGVTNQDAVNFRDDLYTILKDDKFANVRSLITIKGKTFQHIDQSQLKNALDGVSLSEDESAFISVMTNTINSKEVHKIEYVGGGYTSSEGASAFVNHMNNTLGDGVGDKMTTPDGNLSSAWIHSYGDGFNVPTRKGSHSFIGSGLHANERAVTSGHEVFGHGIPAAKHLSPIENNANAIRADNLIRRIIGLPQRDGKDHGGYQNGHITKPYDLPIIR